MDKSVQEEACKARGEASCGWPLVIDGPGIHTSSLPLCGLPSLFIFSCSLLLSVGLDEFGWASLVVAGHSALEPILGCTTWAYEPGLLKRRALPLCSLHCLAVAATIVFGQYCTFMAGTTYSPMFIGCAVFVPWRADVVERYC